MNKLLFFIAMLASKLVRLGLKLIGRNATFLPGTVALKICKDFLGYLTPPKILICVTGTNGKTTTSNLLAGVLSSCGYSVTNNSYGSNVQAGVAAALLADSTFFGKAKKDAAVLEVDERSSLLIYPYITPDYIICNNIMRDSLKRNAHTEFISFILNKAIPEKTKLVLNADDIICSYLAPQCKNRVYFGVEAEKPAHSDSSQVRDIYYCPECGETLKYEYIRYNHIGRVYCPVCGHRTPERDYFVSEIDRENNSFTVKHANGEYSFKLVNDNIVNIYNSCGAVSLLFELGLSYEQISKAFGGLKIVKTRFDTVNTDKLSLTMLLAKGQNPIACARCYSYVAKSEGDSKAALILVDDKEDNTNNCESTCWLYDCDYSFLADKSVTQVVFAGKRCRDQYLRALIAGVDAEKIKITDNPLNGASLIDINKSPSVFVLYDPYLLTEAAAAKKELTEMGGKD